MCRVLKVSASGYDDWRDRPDSRRTQEDRALLVRIRRIHDHSRKTYGAIKTWHVLRHEGCRCGSHRVARLRRAQGIESRRRRRFRGTTQSRHLEIPYNVVLLHNSDGLDSSSAGKTSKPPEASTTNSVA